MNSRTFRITVNLNKVNIPFGTSPHPSKDITSVMLAHGTYFYMGKGTKLPPNTKDSVTYGKMIYAHILILLNKEVKILQKFWINNINNYFNRRAYGRYFGNPNTGANRKSSIKPFIITTTQMKSKNNQPYPQVGRRSFQNTGQLQNALKVMYVSIWGAELYVSSVYAPTNRADYVNFLIHGTRVVKGTPYIPELDKRLRVNGRWVGITPKYWQRWQAIFEQQIKRSETRLAIQIQQYIKQMGLSQKAYAALQQPNLTPQQRQVVIKKQKQITNQLRAGRKI